MTLNDLIAKFDKLIAAVPGIVLEQTEVAALDALALVDQRITQTGVDANGSQFVDYTPNYKKLKTAKGRYRGHVDFMDSGQMLASTQAGFENIVPIEKSVTGATAKVVFDGRDEITKKKLEGNNKYRPGFLNPSKAEVGAVTKIAVVRVEKRIQAILE